MSKTSFPRESADLHSVLKSARGENLNYPQLFDWIGSVIPMAEGVIITTLPRGSLQIAQPPRVSESLLRAYVRDFHAFDRPSWQAIATGQAVRGLDCWRSAEEFEASRFRNDFLRPNGYEYVAAAPLSAPVLPGYPGAIQLYRSGEQGSFGDSELAQLADLARQLDEEIERARSGRKTRPASPDAKIKPRVELRQFIFDSQLRPQLGTDLTVLDDRLRSQMLQAARQRFEHVNGKATAADRLPLPDSNGDLWIFRVVAHKNYPALGEGPFVFFNLSPECGDWSALRPNDFQADAELARLIPALRFMEQEFHRGPTLQEIAKTVHLSPFHFHRRFTELLGITPKHFLLDCQIEEAKRQLLAREQDLADIATACGFAHQSHFTSRFKQATGLTPTRWRRYALERQRSSSN